MLKLGRSEPGMAVTERDLDADPLLLGVKNGVVDLRTGHLLWNHPEMFITRFCNAEFREGADCPKWKKFLSEVFQGDLQTVDAVQRLLGYTLTGYSSEEILVICHGYGSNGKSVFANVVHQIMGDYARTAPPSLLTTRRADDNSPRNDVAALAGARYVSINELQAGDRLDEQVVKMLAGREPISAQLHPLVEDEPQAHHRRGRRRNMATTDAASLCQEVHRRRKGSALGGEAPGRT
jgi:P4 family phage/plasmid primase-like protien